MTLSNKMGEKAEALSASEAVLKAEGNRETGLIHQKGVNCQF